MKRGTDFCYRIETWITDGKISDVGQERARVGEAHHRCGVGCCPNLYWLMERDAKEELIDWELQVVAADKLRAQGRCIHCGAILAFPHGVDEPCLMCGRAVLP